jgi:formylglycine-generating enzyme required for sulfatase activity
MSTSQAATVTPCPDPATLGKLLRDELSPAEAAPVEEHVGVCPGCQRVLQGLVGSLPDLLLGPPRAGDGPLSHPPAPPAGDDRPAIAGYEILGELGRGGMGVVYKARHLRLGRVVALKMILAGSHAGEQDLRRFLGEAEAVAGLQHAHVVQLFDFGQHQGLPFFTLEFVAGGSLADRLAGTPLAPAAAAGIVEQLARGVAYAHERGIVHRDLKPHNVLLAEDGTPKIADFGLAKRVQLGSGLTASGAVMGTPSYMAPEQARGDAKRVGPAADIYALGAILYECLTGRPPFQAATTMQTLWEVIRDEPVPVRALQPAVPRDLETVCHKCLQKEPHRRYAGALALAEDLRRFQAGEPVAARPVGRGERLLKWARRRPTAAVLLLVCVLALLGTLAGVSFYTRQLKETRAAALVESLVTAETPEVPGLVEQLAGYRPWADPHLRRHVQDSPEDSKARLHARLALLPVDPGQVGPLADHLLDAAPHEVAVLRDALRPHAPDLLARLWDAVEQPPPGKESRRLRAACALAAYDPDSPRWQKAAGPVVRQLVAENVVHLDHWLAGFRPVRDRLLPELAAVYRDRAEERGPERRVALKVLAEYAADRPAVLADLIMDADTSQFLKLFPLLSRQREAAVPRLEAVLDQTPQPDWHDSAAEASWATPAAALIQKLEAADGLLAERFALCQTLPLEGFNALDEELRRCGYRPVRLRPYRHGEVVEVAALWTRDGRECRVAVGVSAGELRRRDADGRKQGHQPVDVAGYLADGQERYAAVWVKGTAGEGEADFYAGVPETGLLKEGQQPLMTRGMIARTYHVFLDAEGRRRFSGVWGKPATSSGYKDTFVPEDPGHETPAPGPELPVDVTLFGQPAAPDSRSFWQGQLRQAETILQKQPENLDVRFSRGRACAALGEDEKALADLDAVIAGGKSAAESYAQRAVVRARLGKDEEARRDLVESRRRGTRAAYQASVEARVAVHLGEVDGGLERLEEALAGKEADPDWLYQAACAQAVAAGTATRRRDVSAAATALALGLAAPETAGWQAPLLAWQAGRLQQLPAGRAGPSADRALALLEKALAAGLRDISGLQTDADLDPLRPLPGFADVLRLARLDRNYVALWHVGTGREGLMVLGLTVARQRQRCRELAAQGWRPVSLAGAQTLAGKPLVTASVWQRPLVPETVRDALASRQANAAAALLRLRQTEPVWPLLHHGPNPLARPDPTVRSLLVQRLAPLQTDAGLLVDRLSAEGDVSVRRALILSLGEFGPESLPDRLRQPLTGRLLERYRNDPDAGIHAAIDWLLRHGQEGARPRPLDWGQRQALEKIDRELGGRPPGKRGWYVTPAGQTMTIFHGPVEFDMGSPPSEPDRREIETPHHRRIERSFALAATPVTVRQYEEFLKAYPKARVNHSKKYSPEPDESIVTVSWYDAVQYCRWLSEQDKGLGEGNYCYPSLAEIEKSKDGVTPLKLPRDYLTRKGYRLPTEAEWEYACRAGTATSRYYGNSVALLDRYAWYFHNSGEHPWPVGQKRPNDFGLFDMHGGVWQWCQEAGSLYPLGTRTRPAEDREQVGEITDRPLRVMRGGSFAGYPVEVRSAARLYYRPSNASYGTGLRVARTYD